MNDPITLSWIDLAALLIITVFVAASLRAGRRLTGAIAATLTAGLFIWLGVAGLEAWGSADVSAAASQSQIAQLLPMPKKAV